MSAYHDRRLYGDLAWTWPIVSPPEHYVRESETIARLIRENARGEARRLLHLGSGGGHNDWTLKRHFDVTGVDVSPAMRSLASRLNPEATYLEGDMRTIRLERAFDAVICLDSIDYMLDEAALSAAFATAFHHLRPGGVFLTYAELTRESFRQNRTQATVHEGEDTTIVFIANDFGPDDGDSTIENTFVFLIRQGSTLRVETDRHLTGLFSEATWPRLMARAGFEVHAFGPTALDPDDDPLPVFIGLRP